ncbi:hypothetical protein ACQEU5_19640 [Marinactinospora thermotolerans]|uniref:Uncharacterized protein n=1 Tax=Marinactinospora thermotolerans DSM 45154 TaxID=1122192 RepID=A0A1T4NR09_9ACTN|nr:hypothetical protein [Marinactinospora thermotolerans]SJZ81536.1 hypothetical protein SAMN02745673_01549 [Marinactinospora thermotolerans DSM 45154]
MVSSQRNTLVRSLHDLGLAAWFGGSLMGVIGLNGAAKEADDTGRGIRISTIGWNKWLPVSVAAIAVHVVGGAGLFKANAERVRHQEGVGASTGAKTVLTGAALAATAYACLLGKKVGATQTDEPKVKELAEKTPGSTEDAQRQLRLAQWAVPALTGALLVLNALHGEQQRPSQQKLGFVQKAGSRLGMTD